MEEYLNNLKVTQVVRFSCSDIAGIAGYNPWQDTTILFEKYVYQDMEDLKVLDAKNLDVEIISADDEIKLLVNKLDEQDRIKLREIEKKIELDDGLDTMTKAQVFLSEISKLMKEERVVNKISLEELKIVEEEYLGKIRKGYGITCENRSLDKYECLTGFKVVERNMELIKMKVMPLPVEVIEIDPPAIIDPKNIFSTLLSASKRACKEEQRLSNAASNSTTIASSTTVTSSSSDGSSSSSYSNAIATTISNMSSKSLLKKRRTASGNSSSSTSTVNTKPSFYIVGKVDGISYQLNLASDDPSTWGQIKVVVEMKSRTRRIASPPPIYEQIQLVAYMVILNCAHGDLVQAIAQSKVDGDAPISSSAVPEVAVVNNEIHFDNNFSISRVHLDGGPYHHSKHWHEIIMPRLRAFRDALVKVRKDDGLRYRYLLADPEVKKDILNELCPYYLQTVACD